MERMSWSAQRRGIVLQMIGGVQWLRARHWVQQKAWHPRLEATGFEQLMDMGSGQRWRYGLVVQQPSTGEFKKSNSLAAKQIQDLAEGGGEKSVLEQLKAAAEFWEVFDDIPQPPSDAEAQDDEGQHAEAAEDFEDQLAEHALVEITDEDVEEHRFRVTGTQPPHRLYRPVGATGGSGLVKLKLQSSDLLRRRRQT